MRTSELYEMALFEHRFWLQILGDHSRFIFTSLSPDEKEKVKTAEDFIKVFDGLLEEARKNLSNEELIALNETVLRAVQELRCFKLLILKEELTDNVKISLPPTFINHMLNELDEYIFILNCIIDNRPPSVHPLHHHLLWLLDGAGHANSIMSDLDETEKEFIRKSREFAKDFEGKFIKAVELRGYLRTGLEKFPALDRFNTDVELRMLMFQEFLKELEELIRSRSVLSRLSPLIPDHMYREECYYLTRLSQITNVKEPECNPAKPRVIS